MSSFINSPVLSFPLKNVTVKISITCTRLYTFEKKRENNRKDGVWRQTITKTRVGKTGKSDTVDTKACTLTKDWHNE